MQDLQACPLCQAGSSKQTLETRHVSGAPAGSSHRAFFHCLGCDVFYQWPRLTPEEETNFYRQEFEKFMSSRSPAGDIDWSNPIQHRLTNESQRKRRETYLTPIYEKLFRTTSPVLLEIGCSSGFMLTGLKERYGITCVGVEPSNVFSEFLAKEKYEIYQSLDVCRAKSQHKQFDVITNCFVLEHIQEPKPFILDCVALLKKDGDLVIEIPNAADPLRTLFPTTAFEKFYWSIAHPWYFTEASLAYLLGEQCGLRDFKILKDQRYDIGNHTHWMLEGKAGGQGKLSQVFDETFATHYRESLIRSGKCDTLIAIINKA